MYRDEKIKQLADIKKQLEYVELQLEDPNKLDWERAEYAKLAADYRIEITKRQNHINRCDMAYGQHDW